MKAIIKGGQVPAGKIKISGAKNAATKLLAAALICDTKVTLSNFPVALVDAQQKIAFIRDLGGNIEIDSANEVLSIDANNFINKELSDYNYQFRTTYLLVPGLLKRSSCACIPYPGGCKIGDRGYDLHVSTWQKFGAEVIEKEDYIEVRSENGLSGCVIDFPISTIGGTENALLCASIAKGTSIIKNAYIAPEVDDLIRFLKSTGVEIKVSGNSYIEVVGKDRIVGGGYVVMPDRIEAITWIVYSILSKGEVLIQDVPFSAMEIPLIHMKEAGIDLYCNTNSVYIDGSVIQESGIYPFELATGTYPGIISDMQPFYVLLGLHANGLSNVFDYRYPERIKYCEELSKFYPDRIHTTRGRIKINGKRDLQPNAAIADSTDLRGSMAVVIAALLANGVSEVENIDMALRGYNNLVNKLRSVGVQIEVI